MAGTVVGPRDSLVRKTEIVLPLRVSSRMGETNIDQSTQWNVEVQTVSEQSPKYLVFKRSHSERELAEKGGREHSWDLNPMFRGGGPVRRSVDLEHGGVGCVVGKTLER